MPAPKGNQYYLNRKTFGTEKKYTVEELKQVFFDYLDARSQETKTFVDMVKGGELAGEKIQVDKPLPLTLRSFCRFANMCTTTFNNYLGKEGYEDYFVLSKQIKNTIDSDQIDGALVGLYKDNIVARLQGLADKTETTQNVTFDQAEIASKLSSETLEELAQYSTADDPKS